MIEETCEETSVSDVLNNHCDNAEVNSVIIFSCEGIGIKIALILHVMRSTYQRQCKPREGGGMQGQGI